MVEHFTPPECEARPFEHAEAAAIIWNDCPTDDRLCKWQAKNQVEVSEKQGKYEYSLAVNGERKVLFETAADDGGLRDAETKLSTLIDEKIVSIESAPAYQGVTISRDGDFVGKMRIRGGTPMTDATKDVYARTPTLAEIYGVEAALDSSMPSLRGLKGEGVKFYFLKDVNPRGAGVFAYFDYDAAQQPAVFFQAGKGEKRPITNLDPPKNSHLGGNQGTDASIQSLTQHELAHHHQKKRGWDTESVMTKIAEEIGWKAFHNAKTNQTDYLLKSKETGTDGQPLFYRFTGQWVLSTESGQNAGKNGQPLPDGTPPITVTNAEMRKLALVPPSTDYFRDPIEMFAEALMLYRSGPDGRKQILSGPGDATGSSGDATGSAGDALFKVVAREDQLEIDETFGKASYIRGQDGKLTKIPPR